MTPFTRDFCLPSFLVKYTRQKIGPNLKEFGQATSNLPRIWAFPMLREMKVENIVSEGGPLEPASQSGQEP